MRFFISKDKLFGIAKSSKKTKKEAKTEPKPEMNEEIQLLKSGAANLSPHRMTIGQKCLGIVKQTFDNKVNQLNFLNHESKQCLFKPIKGNYIIS